MVLEKGHTVLLLSYPFLFLLFQTLRDRHTAESTGIGLSIVKRLLDDRKGSIRVESALGQGATFIFTWPKHEATI